MILAALLTVVAYSDELYVINGGAETMSKVDLETDAVTNHILTLGLWPNDILIVRDTAYIVNSGSADVYMYDLIVQSKVRTIDIGSNRNPYRIAQIAPDTFIVTNWMTNTITKITSTGEKLGESPITGDYPQGILVRGDTSFITTVSFVWNDTSYDHGFVAAWDNRGDSTILPIQVGENPNDITLGPDGNLYVVCTGEYNGTGSIYIINPDQLAVLDSIIMGGDPTDIEIVEGGIGFLPAGGGWWPPGSQGDVLTFDAVTGIVLHSGSNPLKTDGGPMTVTIASDSTVFSFNFAASTVTEIDKDGNLLRRFFVGDGAQVGAVWCTGAQTCEYPRGDANASGDVDIDDVVFLIAYIFSSGSEPACDGISGDVDCSNDVDIDDVVYLIEYIFAQGPEPCPY
jgi:DNA-binding beta-propeller fold protein YncE